MNIYIYIYIFIYIYIYIIYIYIYILKVKKNAINPNLDTTECNPRKNNSGYLTFKKFYIFETIMFS